MDTLLARLTATFTPPILGELERTTGLDHARLLAGVQAIGPFLQHALAELSRTPAGRHQISELLPPTAQADPTGHILHVYVYGSHAENAEVERGVNLLIGPGRPAAERVLANALGYPAATLTPLLTPLLLALLKNLVDEQQLDEPTLAHLLQTGDAAFLASGTPEVALVRAAAAAGQDAASLKARFTPTEWAQIARAPLAVAALIIAAAPQGSRGLHKEEHAVVQAIKAAHQSAPPVSLMTLLYPDQLPVGELEQLAAHPDVAALLADVTATVTAAVQAIAAHDPAEADGFRAFLLLVAQRVAEAAREHTVLGLGGVAVSPEEQAMLDKLRTLLS